MRALQAASQADKQLACRAGRVPAALTAGGGHLHGGCQDGLCTRGRLSRTARLHKLLLSHGITCTSEPTSTKAKLTTGVLAGQAEYQQLSQQEVAICTEAAKTGSARVADFDGSLVASLYRRGLLYFSVPIWPDDHVSIPPLEVGFTHLLLKFLTRRFAEGSGA